MNSKKLASIGLSISLSLLTGCDKPMMKIDPSGNWHAGTGTAIVSVLKDNEYKFKNDLGHETICTLADTTINCPGWSVNAVMSADKKQLTWTNGSTWSR